MHVQVQGGAAVIQAGIGARCCPLLAAPHPHAATPASAHPHHPRTGAAAARAPQRCAHPAALLPEQGRKGQGAGLAGALRGRGARMRLCMPGRQAAPGGGCGVWLSCPRSRLALPASSPPCIITAMRRHVCFLPAGAPAGGLQLPLQHHGAAKHGGARRRAGGWVRWVLEGLQVHAVGAVCSAPQPGSASSCLPLHPPCTPPVNRRYPCAITRRPT